MITYCIKKECVNNCEGRCLEGLGKELVSEGIIPNSDKCSQYSTIKNKEITKDKRFPRCGCQECLNNFVENCLKDDLGEDVKVISDSEECPYFESI